MENYSSLNTADYLRDAEGNIRFTKQGIQELSPYFRKAGIDILTIKTEKDYFLARDKASPYFMDWMDEIASEWPDTSEYNLLRTCIFGNSEEAQRCAQRLELKRSLKVITNDAAS